MAFDKTTRNNLSGMVAAARRLLVEEFTAQLQSIYGMQPDGKCLPLEKLPHLSDEQHKTAVLLRDRLEHLNASASNVKNAAKETINRILREQAFTILNRFCALRMCEERGIVQECIRAGINSKGFQIYLKLAGSALGETFDRYRVFLECLEDELSVDLGVLFDRNSPQALLFPRENSLFALLDLLDAPAFKNIWAEDETIGWIYQYYNDPDERKKMRKASAAPRNSRELAVRNQFFTPRYVVEFLTDNTLGRIWYEMTKGETRLKDQCRYLVRRPTEIFLAEGETVPETPDQEDLSQEELLKQPVHIPHRPIKDPREIRLLDPACGSMHFGLYAFDLFEVIYEESWDNGFCPALQEEYVSKDDFLKDIPRLIIEHNIHGVDIDPRATQIAGLSLWLRAQKAWQARGVKPADRPRVRRSNIVCAEPMPGSPEMLDEFVASLDQPILGELVKTVFDKMQLAGEAGSLLKIEEEIRTAIDEAKNRWQKSNEQLPGFEHGGTGLQPVTSNFWETAENRLINALRIYAEQAETDSYQRRLFADDAARGFAFIDLCRKRYDAVVMNPPFGAVSKKLDIILDREYRSCRGDVYGAFVLRAYALLTESGSFGAITNRTGFFTAGYQPWRQTLIYAESSSIRVFADLGSGVLDSALVETAAYCCDRSNRFGADTINLIGIDDKGEELLQVISSAKAGQKEPPFRSVTFSSIRKIPAQPFAYWCPPELIRLFDNPEQLEPSTLEVRQGLRTLDDFRFLRLWWEPPQDTQMFENWCFHLKGGPFQRFFTPPHLLCAWGQDGAQIKALVEAKYGSVTRVVQAQSYYFRFGLTYTRRTSSNLSVRIAPRGCNFADRGPLLVSSDNSKEGLYFLLGYLNSPFVNYLISISLAAAEGAARSYEVGIIQRLPSIQFSEATTCLIAENSRSIVEHIQFVDRCDETSSGFVAPAPNHATVTEWNAICRKAALQSFVDIRSRVELIDHAVMTGAGVLKHSVLFSSYRDFCEKLTDVKDTAGYFGLESLLAQGASLVSMLPGFVFGRWDIRYATGDRQPSEMPDPFDPLPPSPPGMLQNAEGLPAEPKDVPVDYPLRISWHGILVDDENHPEDIVARVREAIEVIWKDRAEAIEQEACEILGVKTLRDYFRRPVAFFADHLKRYSKSRRQAPIYWPLSTKSGSYTLWIYYHRLNGQTLYSCVNDFVELKIREVSREVEQLQLVLTNEGNPKQRDELEKLLSFRDELDALRTELLWVAEMPFKPDLNDGVIINAAPLWKLFSHKPWQKACKECWDSLEAGDYDWAHLAYNIWPDRVREKCRTDKSFAIAHNLESIYEEPQGKPVKKSKKAKTADGQALMELDTEES